MFYITSNGPHATSTANKRRGPGTGHAVVGRVDGIGEVTHRLGTKSDGEFAWHAYYGLTEPYYIREDVHRAFEVDTDELVLDVPYHSQNSLLARFSNNDCGPACATMLLGYVGVETHVDAFMQRAGINHRGFTSFNENMAGIRAFGHISEFHRPMTLPMALNAVKSGQPVMCLVYYNTLRRGQNYGHFVVLVGWERDGCKLNVLYHDPLVGAEVSVPAHQFSTALSYRHGAGNMPFQCLTIT
jgi:hypothetical protein